MSTFQAFINGGTARDESVCRDFFVIIDRPIYVTVGALLRKYKLKRSLYTRPKRFKEIAIPRTQVVMPHAGRNVGAKIGFSSAYVTFHTIFETRPPTAIGLLRSNQPIVSSLRFCVFATDRQGHCGLNMIPWVRMPPFKPWNFTGRALKAMNIIRGLTKQFLRIKPGTQIQTCHLASSCLR